MNNTLYQKSIVSMQDLSLTQIELILATAARFKLHPARGLLKDKIIGIFFFEPSTRTRLSFESATYRLGGHVIGFSSEEGTSIKKGENLPDTLMIISRYVDLLIIRHFQAGVPRLAQEIVSCPVINGGDAANQHPSQALTDLLSIQETQKTINGLSIALVGDLKHSRTIHSLVQALSWFDVRLFLVAPKSLSLNDNLSDFLKTKNIRFSFHETLECVIEKIDILYMTRLQRERFVGNDDEIINAQFILTPALLEKAKPNLKVLHPLPRLEEIDPAIDKTPFAYYFEQAANGVYIRQALLSLILNNQ